MKGKEPVKIAGAGVSGLMSAITLAMQGVSVEVYDRKSSAGGRFWGDLQGLENWTRRLDVLEEFMRMGVKLDFYRKPLPPLILLDGKGMEISFAQPRPLCYLVKRGTDPDTLDQRLYHQALESGVTFRFSRELPEEDATIVATGPRTREVFAVDTGIKFKTDHPDIAIALVNNAAALRGYAYLLVVDGYGCICTVMFDHFEEIHSHYEYAREILDKYLKLKIWDELKVGGVGSFSTKQHFFEDGKYRVGENAGLQDFLWGFGIRSALQSGHMAAKCMLEGWDYDQLALEKFGQQQAAGIVMRYLFEKIGSLHHGYSWMGRLVRKQNDPGNFLRRAYSFTPIHKIIYPLAKRTMRNRYPLLHI